MQDDECVEEHHEGEEDDVIPPSFNNYTDVSQSSGDCSPFEKSLDLPRLLQITARGPDGKQLFCRAPL